eukprot:4050560-Pyramimonas_sp.AAC.1
MLPASDLSVVQIYPRFLRPIGPSWEYPAGAGAARGAADHQERHQHAGRQRQLHDQGAVQRAGGRLRPAV